MNSSDNILTSFFTRVQLIHYHNIKREDSIFICFSILLTHCGKLFSTQNKMTKVVRFQHSDAFFNNVAITKFFVHLREDLFSEYI